MHQTDKIPDFLKERRSRRVLVTIWFGLIPLIMGSIGIYNYFKKDERKYEGSNFKSIIKQKCGDKIRFENCLYIIIDNDTLTTTLSEKYLEVYNASLKQENQNQIELIFVENTIKKLAVNDRIIVKYKSAFWWGIIFTMIGVIWIGGHIWFYIKDPYKKYSDIKDPFSKYKK